MVWIYIVFTFCLLELRVQSESTNNFHSKTQFLAIAIQYYGDKILARDQVFSRQHITGTEFGPLQVKIMILWYHTFFSMRMEEYMESELSGNFWGKLIPKIIVPGSCDPTGCLLSSVMCLSEQTYTWSESDC